MLEKGKLISEKNMNMLRKIIKSQIQFFGRKVKENKVLSEIQRDRLAQLRLNGYVIIEDGIKKETLDILKSIFKKRIEEECDFEMPCLAQKKIFENEHRELIENYFKYTPAEMKEFGVTFERSDVKNYEQILTEFAPSNLKIFLPPDSYFIKVWLDEAILELIEQYMGLRPYLAEAYIRRNFPAKYRVMNHFWHRDRNHPDHLLKAFFFLSDCAVENGPHEYISGSVDDRRLDGKPYFADSEVDLLYPKNDIRRIKSIVKAGTIILEDTRGLHRATLPLEGFRDLGFAVFIPQPFYSSWKTKFYEVDRNVYNELSDKQKKYIPKSFITKKN